jgi:hypothetical protein
MEQGLIAGSKPNLKRRDGCKEQATIAGVVFSILY